MKIIGHRGATSLAPENTIASIVAAKQAGVDAIEFDIRATADGNLILCHDPTLFRTYGIDLKISNLTSKEISRIKSPLGDRLPTLEMALESAADSHLLIECKGKNWAAPLAQVLIDYPRPNCIRVISFNHQELFEFAALSPKTKCYAIANHSPLDVIQTARTRNFYGIDINYWVLNPLVYFMARRFKLDLIVYTVNKPWMAQFLRILYPQISITTDVPQQMQFLRPKKLRVINK